jgi:hypothetical protein
MPHNHDNDKGHKKNTLPAKAAKRFFSVLLPLNSIFPTSLDSMIDVYPLESGATRMRTISFSANLLRDLFLNG